MTEILYQVCQSSCLHRTSIVSKTLFIVPTDTHYYKIIQMLKQFKIITLTPTCFFSRRKHHQGTFLYLAKSTKWFFCARRYRCSQCYGSISACCARLHNRQTFVSKLCYFVNQLTVSQKNSNQSVATSPKPVSLV